MTLATFTKSYSGREAVCQAVAHHAWLNQQAQPLRLPPILAVHTTSIDFGFVDGRHAQVNDAPAVAAALGHAHTAAWASDLHRAHLNRPHPLASSRSLTAFVAPRLAALRQRERDGYASSQEVAAVLPLLNLDPATRVAFYKDTNPRNVLMTAGSEPVMVDVDDLTLAPFGYDLAKLLVTLAMTHGPLPIGTFTGALTAYNQPLLAGAVTPVALSQLLDYAEIHDLLTRPYQGRGGYRYLWSDVRPVAENLL
ncbi:Phosphotransferase enzyme family protein [Sinosporangium album]|uniref:Phosphotransferase enzyme family protein n=1 Tax=Sinosporangium album TaxID=504805 RepID=A0A1G7XID3_9ACTN|nr:phosphotransferase [Sinosporangium album]SDG83989.1 Phosphotransferase enzyme family protein [Sinosporangium album]